MIKSSKISTLSYRQRSFVLVHRKDPMYTDQEIYWHRKLYNVVHIYCVVSLFSHVLNHFRPYSNARLQLNHKKYKKTKHQNFCPKSENILHFIYYWTQNMIFNRKKCKTYFVLQTKHTQIQKNKQGQQSSVQKALKIRLLIHTKFLFSCHKIKYHI